MRRPGIAVLFVVVALILATPSAPVAQMGTEDLQRARVLGRPVLDGLTLGGVTLDTPEGDVVARFGPVSAVIASLVAQRALRYELEPGVFFDVHVTDGVVRAVGITCRGTEAPDRSPQTVRGVRLGAPAAHVVERYGEPPNGRLWYAAEGVAFNVEGDASEIESILIFARGTTAP